ncbi:MAG: hypothetical protein IPN95_12185 [Bacteroidetes bacterium]|nr:hypothetical protein [Bacteroidota bacterium]
MKINGRCIPKEVQTLKTTDQNTQTSNSIKLLAQPYICHVAVALSKTPIKICLEHCPSRKKHTKKAGLTSKNPNANKTMFLAYTRIFCNAPGILTSEKAKGPILRPALLNIVPLLNAQ